MSYLVLARKYRPATFAQVIGQEHITQTLTGALVSGRLAHAFCFTGPRGVGKTSVARILAKALNCRQGPTPTPCGVCPACTEIDEGRAVDVQEIDAASNSHVEDVRELREMIRYHPQSWRYRITILDEVHMLSKPAFNALLKTLEEPPAHAVFILATTDVHKLPATILSRCQRYDFRRLGPALLAAHLAQVCRAENFHLEERSLMLLANEADGSTRDALSLLDQVLSYGEPSPDHQQVVSMLGLVDRALVKSCALAILDGNAPALLDLIDQIYQAGGEMQAFYGLLEEYFRNLAAAPAAPEGQAWLGLSLEELQEFKAQAAAVSPETIHEIFNHLAYGEEIFRRAQHPRLVMEMLLLKLTQIKPVLSMSSIIAMLEKSPSAPLEISPELLKIIAGQAKPEKQISPEEPFSPPGPPEDSRGARVNPDSSPQELITGLSDYVKKYDAVFANFLRQGAAQWQEEILKVGLSGGNLARSYCSPEKQAVLNSLATEMWEGAPPLIQLYFQEKDFKPGDEAGRLNLQEVCEDPAIKAAMDILQAEPVEIRPLPRPAASEAAQPEIFSALDEENSNPDEYYEEKNDVS
ncbi:MAG: DNA polymerase III subunit gamma/tau [Desulfarculales bacterium]|jgi:DNA polymerase-3 subunit gamma/tau|nr:DNA polymerase III subunit gamma/tau [Desulfarculales bacterium]